MDELKAVNFCFAQTETIDRPSCKGRGRATQFTVLEFSLTERSGRSSIFVDLLDSVPQVQNTTQVNSISHP